HRHGAQEAGKSAGEAWSAADDDADASAAVLDDLDRLIDADFLRDINRRLQVDAGDGDEADVRAGAHGEVHPASGGPALAADPVERIAIGERKVLTDGEHADGGPRRGEEV